MQRRIFIPVVFLTFLTFSLAGNQIVSKSDSLRRLIGKTGSKAEIFNQLAELWIDSLPEESAAFADSALLAAGSTEEKARAYYNKGEAFYFLNENEKALEAYTQALNLFMESGMLKQQANCFITIGI
ncbi:MAG: tetratricopeptide repeat protein, partial [Bacteroidota bacterium]